MRFYVLFNSISVIIGRCSDNNERLCAMELRFTVGKISPRVRIIFEMNSNFIQEIPLKMKFKFPNCPLSN